jgi:hypothetical protein
MGGIIKQEITKWGLTGALYVASQNEWVCRSEHGLEVLMCWSPGKSQDPNEHTLHAEAGDESVLFHSGILQPAGTFPFVRSEAGTYDMTVHHM